MKYRPFFIFLTIILSPQLAWSCFYREVWVVTFNDFLVLGVMAGVGFRLFLEDLMKLSRDISAAMYVSLLIASLGAGSLVTDDGGLGDFDIFPIMMALLGAFVPQNRVKKFLWLGPIFLLMLWASKLHYDGWNHFVDAVNSSSSNIMFF